MNKQAEQKWTDYDAIAACEGFDGIEHTKEELISAWQHLIDTGLCWKLQGWFGRTAQGLIENGICKTSNVINHERIIQ